MKFAEFIYRISFKFRGNDKASHLTKRTYVISLIKHERSCKTLSFPAINFLNFFSENVIAYYAAVFDSIVTVSGTSANSISFENLPVMSAVIFKLSNTFLCAS